VHICANRCRPALAARADILRGGVDLRFAPKSGHQSIPAKRLHTSLGYVPPTHHRSGSPGATISSGLQLFLAIVVLLFPIYQGGPIPWGGSKISGANGAM
jgi:hypothetical protein